LIEQAIENLKKEIKKLDGYWVDEIIRPIAKLMNERLPDRVFNVLGPFGLMSEVSIHFYKKGASDRELFKDDNCLSIDFRPGNLSRGEILVVNNKIDTKEYANKSIGALNGANHPTVVMLPDIDWLMHWLIKENRDKIKDTSLLLAYGF
jgi:hypothetical protein